MINALLLASLMAVGLGLGLQMQNGLHRRPCSFLWGAAFLLLFVLMPLLASLSYGPVVGVGWNPSLITDAKVYVIYGAMTLAFSFAYLLTSVPWGDQLARRMKMAASPSGPPPVRRTALERRLSLVVGLLVVAGAAAFVLGTGLSPAELLRGGRFAHYGEGTVRGPLLLLGLYLVGLIAVYAFFDVKHGFPNRWFSLLVYATILFMMVIGGGRKWLIFAASGWLAGGYDRRGSLKVSFRVLAGLAVLVTVLTGWQVVRAVGWLDPTFVLSFRDMMVRRLPTLLWEGDASYFFRASMEAIRLNDSQDLMYPFAILRRIVLLPLPAELTFGLKPGGIPDAFARELNFYTATRMGNLPPGLYGLFVLSFGWQAALFLGPILTLAGVRVCDWLAMRSTSWVRDVVFASFAMVMVLLMRGSEGSLYFLAFNLVVVGIARMALLLLPGTRAARCSAPHGGTP